MTTAHPQASRCTFVCSFGLHALSPHQKILFSRRGRRQIIVGGAFASFFFFFPSALCILLTREGSAAPPPLNPLSPLIRKYSLQPLAASPFKSRFRLSLTSSDAGRAPSSCCALQWPRLRERRLPPSSSDSVVGRRKTRRRKLNRISRKEST